MQKKKIVVAIVALAIVAAGVWAWHTQRKAPDAAALVLHGNVELRQISLAFNASERVAALHPREGDRVSAGQVLGSLDTRALDLRIAQGQAQMRVREQALRRLQSGTRPQEIDRAKAAASAAETEADHARQQLERLRGIRQSTSGRAVSQQDLDTALARADVARAQLESARQAVQLAVAGPRKEDLGEAQAQLEVARAELALLDHQRREAELKAPVDAVVRSRLLEPGDMASPQRPAFNLAITHPKWVRAYLSEVDLGRIRPGMPAQVTTDSHPQSDLPGRVGFISSVAEFTPRQVQTEELRTSLVYEVRIWVDDPGDRLRLGMPATVRIRFDDALVAGASARP